MRISDWSSDVCSSDLPFLNDSKLTNVEARYEYYFAPEQRFTLAGFYKKIENPIEAFSYFNNGIVTSRSEEHTSELPSLMRISYAVFCLKTTIKQTPIRTTTNNVTHITNTTPHQ